MLIQQLKKLKIGLANDPAIQHLGNVSEEHEKLTRKGTCTPCSLQHYLQDI